MSEIKPNEEIKLYRVCSLCQGKGRVPIPDPTPEEAGLQSMRLFPMKCPHCDGTGKLSRFLTIAEFCQVAALRDNECLRGGE